MNKTSFRSRGLRIALILVALLGSVRRAAADALWDSRPYQVAIVLDASQSDLSVAQKQHLQRDLQQSLQNRLARFWRVRWTTPTEETPADEASAGELPLDKRFDVTLRSDNGAYRVDVVEVDVPMDNAGPPVAVRAATLSDLPERLYSALLSAFRPVATFQRSADATDRVTLAYRAAEVAPSAAVASARAGELLTPFRRRLDREGNPLPATPVSWTYLVAEAQADGSPLTAEVVSHARRPFGVRPSGRVEQIAIAAPANPTITTVLRLHALDEPTTPLPGYEVSLGRPGSENLLPLGYTNQDGAVQLPNDGGVWMAHVRCGSLVVASVPVAAGVAHEIVVPLVDERSRLRAELEVTRLREELIDTVARRKILAERIRRLVLNEQTDAAKRLLVELEELPGRTQFTRQLESAQRAAKSNHPVAKARLDRLFDKTMSVLGSALDPRETRDLAVEINRSEQAAAARPSTEPTPQEG